MSDYYGTWRTDKVSCNDECGWTGTGEECVEGEMFQDLFELNCPRCSRTLLVVTYPTLEASRANWDKVSDEDKLMVQARENFLEQAERTLLRSPEQLPDVEGEPLFFVWDQDGYDTVIRYGPRIIWTERAFYDGYIRWIEVAKILAQKYGSRIKDLLPVYRSLMYLCGDCLSADHQMDKVRRELGWWGKPFAQSS